MGLSRFLTISDKGLRYKLLLAFGLMSIIPLLVIGYILSTYVFPQAREIYDISAIALFAIVVSLLGWLLTRRLVNPVIDMSIEAKMIASGEYGRNIAVQSDDEVGDLAGSINAMTRKIRMNLDEIKGYSSRMKEINIEINKKVLALSSLLQIGDILSAGAIKIDSLLELALEKASSVVDGGFGILYTPREESGDMAAKIIHNTDNDRLTSLVITKNGHGVMEKMLVDGLPVIIDKGARLPREVEEFRTSSNLRNGMIIPLTSGKRVFGLLIIGNRAENFKFKTDDVDLVKVFAKQIVIALESDFLAKRAEKLAIKDDLTDLYNKSYIMTRLEEEIKRAIFYQRPCSFIAINIDNFKHFRDANGELAGEEAIRRMAKLLKDSATPVSKVARIGGDEFAIVVPEKNKKEAMLLADEIRKKAASTNLLRDGRATLTVSCGVSENPIDGATADELFKKASDAMKEAKLSGKNKVVA